MPALPRTQLPLSVARIVGTWMSPSQPWHNQRHNPRLPERPPMIGPATAGGWPSARGAARPGVCPGPGAARRLWDPRGGVTEAAAGPGGSWVEGWSKSSSPPRSGLRTSLSSLSVPWRRTARRTSSTESATGQPSRVRIPAPDPPIRMGLFHASSGSVIGHRVRPHFRPRARGCRRRDDDAALPRP